MHQFFLVTLRMGGREPTSKRLAMLNEATDTEKDCVGAWNRLYNNGGNKRMFFNQILCHDRYVMPTISSGHNCLFDYANKKSISSNDIIHAQTFPEDYNFGTNTFSSVNYVCGMSVPPIMIKRIVQRIISSGVFENSETT